MTQSKNLCIDHPIFRHFNDLSMFYLRKLERTSFWKLIESKIQSKRKLQNEKTLEEWQGEFSNFENNVDMIL